MQISSMGAVRHLGLEVDFDHSENTFSTYVPNLVQISRSTVKIRIRNEMQIAAAIDGSFLLPVPILITRPPT